MAVKEYIPKLTTMHQKKNLCSLQHFDIHIILLPALNAPCRPAYRTKIFLELINSGGGWLSCSPEKYSIE
jgi:hypothetical protein